MMSDHPSPTTSGGHSRAAAFGAGLLAFLVGLAFAFYLFPADMMLDRWSWWDKVRGDNTTGLIGYLYLAQDQWRWPLTVTTLFNPPAGVNIVYTDPVPVAALAGKLVYGLFGTLPLYMGSWILLAYGLQSFTGWLIFRQVGLRPFVALLACLLILLLPAFTYRVGHIGLIAHWVILAAILFYLRAISVATRREMYLWAVAIGSILAINPYLLAMAAMIFLAGVAEALWRSRITWRDGAGLGAVMLATTGILAVAFGIVGQGGGLPSAGGFGVYSMNLLSPIIPQLSAISGLEKFELNATVGQYEGFNYLGGGVLLLALGLLAFRFRAVGSMLSHHRFLIGCLIILTVYALSNRIYIGYWFVGKTGYSSIPWFNILSSIFRASGRFFWPVAYCIIIGAVAGLACTVPRRKTAVFLIAAVMIQWIDIQPLVVRTQANALPQPALIDQLLFAQAAHSHSEFTLYPQFLCAEFADQNKILQIQSIAARAGIPSNGAYINRPQLECEAARVRFFGRIDAESSTPNPLIVILKGSISPNTLASAAISGFVCRDNHVTLVCSRKADDTAFIAMGPVLRAGTLPTGQQLAVGDGGEGVAFLGRGWERSDGNMRWAEGTESSIVGRLDKPTCNALIFRALVEPLAHDKFFVRTSKLVLNNRPAGRVGLTTHGPQLIEHRIPLGGRCLEEVDMKLLFGGRARTPKNLGINDDSRRLTWLFAWYSFTVE